MRRQSPRCNEEPVWEEPIEEPKHAAAQSSSIEEASGDAPKAYWKAYWKVYHHQYHCILIYHSYHHNFSVSIVLPSLPSSFLSNFLIFVVFILYW